MSIYITNDCSSCPPFLDIRMAYMEVVWGGFESLLYALGPLGIGGIVTSGGYDNRGGEGRWLRCTVRIECLNGEWQEDVFDADPWSIAVTQTRTHSAGFTECTVPSGVATDTVVTSNTDTNYTYQTVKASDHSVVYSTVSRILTVDNSMNIWRGRMEAFLATQDLTTYSAGELRKWHYDSTYAGGPVSDTGGTFGTVCNLTGGFYYAYDTYPKLYCVKFSMEYENADVCIVNNYTEASDDYQTPHVELVQANDYHCHTITEPIVIEPITDELGQQMVYYTPCLVCSTCHNSPSICNPAP